MISNIGDGHLNAMFRQGLLELRQAVDPLNDREVDSMPGLYGTITQGAIADAKGAIAFMLTAKGESHGTLSCAFKSVRASSVLVG
jgi:hypothetical protein